MKGFIHSFESFGTVDGPGIRFVIFMQGCPLRCAYCHNPDTWEGQAGKQYTSDELVKEVLKYRNYLKNGGVTISGGEPLWQIDFLIELCQKLKENHLHVAVDTSGAVNDERIKELIKYVDLFLLDIKHINRSKCLELTGKPNDNTLAFANMLSDNSVPVWIRYVLVPSVTNKTDDLLELKKFVDTLNNVEKIEILPYHTLGVHKYQEMGIAYRLEGIKSPSLEEIKEAKAILHV